MSFKTLGKSVLAGTFLAITVFQFNGLIVKSVFGIAPLTSPLTGPSITTTPTPTTPPLTSPITATPTPTDAPLSSPEQGGQPSETPTPTVTPTVTPEPVPAPSNNNNSNNGGSNNGGSGGGSSSGGGGNSGPSVCTNEKPKSGPYLFSAKKSGKNAITLMWKKGWGPVNGYTAWYGQTKDASQYTSTTISGEEQIKSTTIGGLNPYAVYYFKVQPLNGCQSGDFSNVITSTGKIIYRPLRIVDAITAYMPLVSTKTITKTTTAKKVTQPVQETNPPKKSGFFDFHFH